MKRILFLFALLFVASIVDAKTEDKGEQIYLETKLVDPTQVGPPIKKSPFGIPSIYLDGHVIYFNTPCNGYTLRILNKEGGLIYSIVIPEGAASIILPSFLSGEYQLEIIRVPFCFYGFIRL